MVRQYQRQRGNRQYINYTDETLAQALDDIKKGRRSQREACLEYGIPKTTLSHKLRGLHGKCVGAQKRLSTECEDMIVSAIGTLTDWKVPMTGVEIRSFVKNYLDALDLPDEIFPSNLPGRDWLRGFMKRYGLRKRKADNVSHSRAEISPETVNSYFDHLQKELEGIPASNIFNYDETNLSDDPGSLEVIVHRGLRRVERVVEHSKSCTSVMFCGSADGKYLPPMVVYKCLSGNVYEGWMVGGPPNVQYASTKSGWFDKETFSRWFFGTFLPVASKLEGPVALIGDNIGSHFSLEVIQATLEYNIKFITMPPCSTHLCQPLDVAVFRALKSNWRKILDQWRTTSRHEGCIPKANFPGLLSRLCSNLTPSHLQSGFRSSGIYPLDRNEVLKRLAGQKGKRGDVGVDVLNASVIDLLKRRCAPLAAKSKSYRGKKQKSTPGKRIVTLKGYNSCWKCRKEDFDEEGGDKWIQCDTCDSWYHLQCSGIEYLDPDELDIAAIEFVCCK